MKSLCKFFAVLTLALAFGAATPQANAQTHNRRLVLTTLFPFTIENREIPAGSYEITFQDGWLRMQTVDGKTVTSILTLPVSSKPGEESGARVVFHRYHHRYFLSQVWLAASDRGRQTLESRDEQRSRKVEAPQAVVVQLTAGSDGQSR